MTSANADGTETETETETEMSGENWESLITEKGFMRVPRALRLRRAELGITNNEYTILLDYVDYYSFSGTMNPYKHLTEVSGMNERSVRRLLTSLEKKGLLRRKVSLHGNGRTRGVVFSVDPLVRKLRTMMKKMSPTVGEENVPYVGVQSVPPNTREEFIYGDESENTPAKNAGLPGGADFSANVNEGEADGRGIRRGAGGMNYGFIRETGGPYQEAPRNDRNQAREGDAVIKEGKAGQIHLARAGRGPRGPITGEGEEMIEGSDDTRRSSVSADSSQEIAAVASKALPRNDSKRGAGGYSHSRWYNEVFRGLYESAAGQPALTGGREYKSAETYFRRLRELNPEMPPGEIYDLAGEGAAFMLGSQMEGGVFGWIHKPPDICLLASQAQSVEWHLRKMRQGGVRDGPGGAAAAERGGTDVRISFTDKLREGQDANEKIERVYGELRGIESASRRRALPDGSRAVSRKRG